MPEDDASLLVLVVVAVVAVIGLGLSVSSFATDQSMGRMMGGGGMMGGTGGTTSSSAAPGALEWTVLILSVAFLALAVGLILMRSRGGRNAPGAAPGPGFAPAAVAGPAPTPAPAVPVSAAAVPSPAATAPVPEPTLVKLLDEDERRMYLEIRDHGGEMLQRDLVALGIFSKPKVTRVLDKLEAKGLVVREAHGMTNRVRLTGGFSR